MEEQRYKVESPDYESLFARALLDQKERIEILEKDARRTNFCDTAIFLLLIFSIVFHYFTGH